ncbi:hypothetical protein [Rhizobium sp. RCAM05973]|uniref:hypothetical protein n=1 Tax=Rhizobium sp. RCAM05973 TaxID=2994066 RepID=UPI0022EC0AD1|nr:hypothetical protein [Rhizobium sp. RCAM05973]
MTRLIYDNIFEAIEPNKKKAARMQGACDAEIDLRTILEDRGMRAREIKSIVKALHKRVFARYI